jgi:hypothetical protein
LAPPAKIGRLIDGPKLHAPCPPLNRSENAVLAVP